MKLNSWSEYQIPNEEINVKLIHKLCHPINNKI